MGKDSVPLCKVLVGISCSGLKSADFFSKSDPQVSVKQLNQQSNQWTEIYKTEKIMNNLNPSYREFEMDYSFESLQMLRFEVYDIDDHKNDSVAEAGQFLGLFSTSLAKLARYVTTTEKLKDFRGNDVKSGSIAVNVRQVDQDGEELGLNFSASNVPQKGKIFKKDPSTSILVESINYKKVWSEVFCSAPVYNTPNPVFGKFCLKLSQLSASGQENDKIRISICKAHKKSSVYGFIVISVAELVEAAKKTKSWNVGFDDDGFTINLEKCSVNRAYTFIDYIQDGLDINLAVAIDFTASNGDPSSHHSLHFINQDPPTNDYSKAIETIGRIVEEYDTDKMFPVFGFGATTPLHSRVSHKFPLNMNKDDPNCHGIDGVLSAYRDCIALVNLSGPTNFEPVIREIIKAASGIPITEKRYYLLLIITDGVITDLPQTVNAIIDASNLPMSIIIVGVGDADFEEMNFLDSDNRLLRSVDGRRQSKRDIIQFVAFDQFRWKSLSELAKCVLAELPNQVTEFYISNGIYPRNLDN